MRPRHGFLLSFVCSLIWLGAPATCLIGCSSGSASGPATQPVPVAPASTVTTLTASTASASPGMPVILTATTKFAAGGVPAGSVSFSDGAASLGTSVLDSSGNASVTTSALTAGAHTITATFSMTATAAASTSAAVTVTIATRKTATSVTLTLAPTSTAVAGLPIELVASSSASGASAVPAGNVIFYDGTTSLGTAALDATGRAITTTLQLAATTHSLSAVYAGNAVFAGSTSPALSLSVAAVPGAATYTNPLKLSTPGGPGVNCADPATLKVQASGVNKWYLYCTSDALFSGDPSPHYINVFESKDLINFTYDGNAFSGYPAWAPKGPLWAPAVRYVNGQYMMYYTSPTSNIAPTYGAAVGVGISTSPTGPFVDHGVPVVEPEPTAGDCCGGRARSTIDPDVVTYNGQNYITFGSFDGGIFVRTLSADGLTSDPSSEVQIAATNRYEGGALWLHGGFYYLFASSANCCNGPLTGYSVFVGRAPSPLGPFLDKTGTAMTAVNAGGYEVLAQNGNNWVGPGGNVLFTDESGRDYMLYHAVSLAAPVVSGTIGYTSRPALIDAMEWGADGWPTVRGGFGPSATAQPAPAAQPATANAYVTNLQSNDLPGSAIAALSDEFNSSTLAPQWTPLHASPAYSLAGGAINLPTVSLDSCCQMAQLPILAEAAPTTDYMVETKLTMNLPVTGSGVNYAQGDLFIYGDDQNFLRLDLYANAATRQIEFLKQMSKVAAYDAINGASNLAQPVLNGGVISAYLRIAKRTVDGQATYTAYSSPDGLVYTRGATWRHTLTNERIGIAGANLAGFNASFDYIRVTTLQ